MSAKVFRLFCGEYIPDPQKLLDKKVKRFFLRKSVYLVSNDEFHGHGRLKGTVRKLGVLQPYATLAVYDRQSKQLIWGARCNSAGAYTIFNVKLGLECFLVAFDPKNRSNAAVKDRQVAK